MKILRSRYVYWILLAAAIALVAIRYMPALFVGYFNSDSVTYGVFLRDVYEHGGNARHFVWSGRSDLFPDLAVVFAVYQITGDPLLALEVCTALIFLGFVAATVVLYRASGGHRTEAIVPLAAAIWVAAVTNVGGLKGMALNDAFIPSVHGDIKVMALFALSLVQRHAFSNTAGRAFWLLAGLCLMTALSDPLFAVIFTAPAVLMMLTWRLAAPDRPQAKWVWIGNVTISTVLGVWLGPHIAPYDVSDIGYAHISFESNLAGLNGLLAILKPLNGGFFVLAFAAGSLTIPAAVGIFRHPPHAITQCPARDGLLRLLLFAALLFLVNFGVLLILGSFRDELQSLRYFSFALFVPVVVAAMFVVECSPWTDAAVRAAYITATVLIVGLTIRIPEISGTVREGRQLVPFLRELMARERIDNGLTDYWYANSLTFLSNNDVRLRAVAADGAMLNWINNRDWYIRKPNGEPVEFRLILLARPLDSTALKERYGRPDKMIATPMAKEAWIYETPRRIVYVPSKGDLFAETTEPAEQRSFRFVATSLKSQTGHHDGDAVVATPHDAIGYITYGPYIPLPSGRYQLTISYVYRAKPSDGQEVLYDGVLWKAAGAAVVDAAALAVGDGPQELRRELTVDNPDRRPFEARTYYRGSGVIEIRSISLSPLTPVDQQ